MAPTPPSSSSSRTKRLPPAQAASIDSKPAAKTALCNRGRNRDRIALLPLDLGKEARAAHRDGGDRRVQEHRVRRQLGDGAGDIEQRAVEEVEDEGEPPTRDRQSGAWGKRGDVRGQISGPGIIK